MIGIPYARAFPALPDEDEGSAATTKSQFFLVTLPTGCKPSEQAAASRRPVIPLKMQKVDQTASRPRSFVSMGSRFRYLWLREEASCPSTHHEISVSFDIT
jgi:hypothetical protein